MALAERFSKRLQQPQPVTDPVYEYMITDPHHRPDLRGEFAGAKVYYRGGNQFVKLTASQAQFYLDGGALSKVNA